MRELKIVKPVLILVALIVLLSLFSLCTGTVWISPGEILSAVTQSESSTAVRTDIILRLRIPRLLTAFLVGIALAAAGSIFQSIIRNPLGDPFLLGVSSGSALGMVVSASLGIGGMLAGIPVAGILGGLTAIFVVYFLSKRGGKVHTTRLILAGIVVSSYTSALTMLILARSESVTVQAITFWMMGDLSYHDSGTIIPLLIISSAICAFVILISGRINVLMQGDDVARQLGINIETLKIAAIFAASLLTGVAVAAAGVIGFVGLIVPNLVRYKWGSDFRKNFILSSLAGVLLLVVADIVVKLISPVSQLPIGIVTALAGAPFFIYLLARSKD